MKAMPERGWATLTMKQVYFDALKSAYDAKKKDLLDQQINTFNKYVNEYLIRGLAFAELGIRLRLEEFTENEVVISDSYLGNDFIVQLIKGTVLCTTDQSTDCIHVFFAKEHPKVRKALQVKGVRT